MERARVDYDVAVIGGGIGGYPAALRAVARGLSACVIEKERLGGTCLQRGCIPTKSLLASAGAFGQAAQGEAFGFTVTGVRADWPAMLRRSAANIDRLEKGVAFLLERAGVRVHAGTGRLAGPGQVEVRSSDGVERLAARSIVLATGSRPLVPPEFGYDGRVVITTDEAVALDELPERIAIVGGGVSGCEFASLFAALGVRVSVIEAMPQLLPSAEPDVARQLHSLFRRRQIAVYLNDRVASIQKGATGAALALRSGERLEVDRVLVAIGRQPVTEGLGLESAGLTANGRGELPVDKRSRTAAPGLYAVGDMTDVAWKLAHVATRQGMVAAENAAGAEVEADWSAVPAVVFSQPEVAWVGLTTPQAEAAGLSVAAGRLPFAALGKAVVSGETEGFIKVITDSARSRLLGVHIIGPEAATLIAEATLAVRWQMRPEQLALTLHAHPTLPEGLADAVESLLARG